MNTGRTFTTNRTLLAGWIVAIVLALIASFGPMALDNLAGTSLTSSAAACVASGGGC
jgi:hypothetical protein